MVIFKHSLIFTLIMYYSALSYAANDRYAGPDFSATKVSVDESGKQVSQIYMSKYGFREELMTNVPVKIIYISNYKQKNIWMVVPSKKLLSDMSTMPGHEQSIWINSTVFDEHPCKGFDKTKLLKSRIINNQPIEEWGCINTKSKSAVLQWFNTKTKMVIREKDKATDLGEIMVSNINFENLSRSLFEIPKDYKKISMIEMMKLMQ